MLKVIKLIAAATTFIATSAVSVSTVAASTVTQKPKVVHTKAKEVQVENPLLRKYATVAPPDEGDGRGCGIDWDPGNRGGHWWG